ncbi:gamma-glutamyl-gamma-aminobutyrate hydrolase family protein [Roseateles violae]|uniref:Gamma-glutamyl-gamma-aminobutyrate hydrolase family protein n=1 Tax=Roseateles violae TaxID=3058042 RepID=A0ABT8DTW0_9BURK|nr:gamma-glutamyl-gamma-aminobutyrate hydrolase family protein [Pelomonas sp. PFR6]MDN3921717.1 gamma-glutamyl-gamma-aminobutyrate hydrolase family protein [Pelomonas sp. PFR6]
MKQPSKKSRKPLVLVPACNRMMGDHPFQMAGKKYIDAVRLAGCLPLIVPSSSADEVDELLDHAEGVFLTGSKSNVHASHYGETTRDESLPQDRVRDDWVLPLIPKAIARGLPILGICRGFQEANVALGGSLHQAVQEQPGLADHRAGPGTPDEQYAFAHEVDVQADGLLAGLLDAPRIRVNSLHGQGIKRLAEGLRIEAKADDGLVEAFSVEGARGFALFVQWHPEWQAASNPVSQRILAAFGRACMDYQGRDPET